MAWPPWEIRHLPCLLTHVCSKLHNLESIRRSPPVGWGVRRIQAYFMWAKQVTDSEWSQPGAQLTSTVCAPSNPALAARLQRLYETAYTRVNGEYFPCHPDVCGPLTEVSVGRSKTTGSSRTRYTRAAQLTCPAGGEGPRRLAFRSVQSRRPALSPSDLLLSQPQPHRGQASTRETVSTTGHRPPLATRFCVD